MIASHASHMHVLLVRPIPGNDRFGLGPFFRIEPLGLEYIAAALETRGHRATVGYRRYGGSIDRELRPARPAIVRIACMHVLLVRPIPENDRFGLGPFFRIEP